MVLAAFGEYKAENYYFCNVHFETSTQKQLILVVLYRAVVPRNYFSWYENRSLDSVRLLAKVKG